MHIMIATDGSLDVDSTVSLVSRLAGGDAKVTVYTVVEIPRGMLDEMRSAARGLSLGSSTETHTVEYRTEQAETPSTPERWIGDDTVLAGYIGSKVSGRTTELMAGLAAAGVEADVVGEEGENASRSVLQAATDREVDVLCIGTRGAGLFDGLLGSTSTKIARLAPCSVLLVRS